MLLNTDGTFTYTPNAGYSGPDTFVYNAQDSSGQTTNSVTVTLNVRPAAFDDTYSTSTNAPLTVATASGVFKNDLGTSLAKNTSTTATKGTVTLNSDGSFLYTPNTGFSGVDTFTYTAKDPSTGTSNTATVTVTVNPVAVNDTYTTTANTALNQAAAGSPTFRRR